MDSVIDNLITGFTLATFWTIARTLGTVATHLHTISEQIKEMNQGKRWDRWKNEK